MPVLAEVAGGLAAELAGLRELDPQMLADGDTIVALHAQLAILQTVVTPRGGRLDAGRSWEADGARSAASRVGTRCKLPAPASRHRIRLGRDLRHMPRWRRPGWPGDGLWFADGIFDAVDGTVFDNVLREVYDELFEQGWVERVVFNGGSRVIDLGEKRRFFSGALRRAIQVRDRVCGNEFCDVPAEECEIDHIDLYCEVGSRRPRTAGLRAAITTSGRRSGESSSGAGHRKRGEPRPR